MKNLTRFMFVVGCFLVMAPIVVADISIPTTTTVYFEIPGEPQDYSIDYRVECYGYSWDPGVGDVAPEGYDPEDPELVYSYNATCPEYGCEIYEDYYLNYRHIEYCNLNGSIGEDYYFELYKFADTPVPEDCTDDGMSRVCTVTYEIYGISHAETWDDDIFTDVDPNHLYFTAIDYVKADGIVQGYSDGTYKPEDEINRAEFTKIIIEATYGDSEIEDCTPTKTFSDIPAGEWYEDYVCVAANNGIIDGYDDGTFKGVDKINFVEAAKIIVTGFDLDYEEGGEWYEGYVNVLQENNYIPPAIDELDKEITRGEMAELVWRIMLEITEKTSIELITEPVEPIVPNSTDYPGWATYSGDGFSFYHPGWYIGTKWGYDTLSPEYDFIFGDKEGVDVYLHAYTKAGSTLETDVWFDHPLVSSEYLMINGLNALKRCYRAPRGTVVNGRTTGEDENITVYSYQIDGKVGVLQYFNAYGTENKDVDIFFDIAESFYQN